MHGACSHRPPLLWLAGLLAVGSVLSGCAGYQHYTEGKGHIEAGRRVAGVEELRQAMEASPSNAEYRKAYFEQRERALQDALHRMELALEAREFLLARAELVNAGALQPGDPRVQAGEDRIRAAERHAQALDRAEGAARAERLDEALQHTAQVLSENPQHRRAALLQRQWLRQQADRSGRDLGLYPKLKAAYRKPVSLSFVNAGMLQVFESLKLASGLNFMFDREVRTDQRVTLSVANKSVEDVLRLLLATNQLDRRVLDEDTVLVYPATPAKQREYQELVTRSFYVSNADITKSANLVRSIAKARDVFVDENLNLLVVRDSAEVVRLAEKLLANQDLAEPEVMLELEVLEVATNRLTELGLRWPDAISASVVGRAGTKGALTVPEIKHFNSDLVRLQLNDPVASAKLRAERGDSNLLANPRIRVRNRQTAKVLIGERVPVITTTNTANVGTSESVNYLDVGLKLDIEPSVSLDGDVAMKVALEVSNILETITRATGTQAYRLGTRNTSTNLRVRDGETQVLAGLIQRDERSSNNGLPIANDVPLLNKLFGQGSNSKTKTEIVLLITPHIVRNVNVPGPGQIEFLSGTEGATGAAPIQLRPAYQEPPPSARRDADERSERPRPAPVPSAAEPAKPPPAFTPPPIVPN
ncbi:secretin and TonB N-terminal domain-containing protein [Eleftheria terrae]|uniref:secretin and TonB N-terminal domain-containing protein n=1 Tax=Eleftheria terrae TaxID=1597781 RepID=UPI00263B36C0|nr:secretin and TonB N-terminal domain-containing protein [Eleftheria terrae]WKB56145.1 secretin and TonB N-terminal domain-containing protein [Eleftheria terrae]